MLKYNLATAFRSIKRNLSFSLINISGLSFGLALVIILFTWLQFEFSFDKFHENAWWEGIQENDYSNRMSWLPVDQDFINTLKIELAEEKTYLNTFPLVGIRISRNNFNSYFIIDCKLAYLVYCHQKSGRVPEA